MDPPVSKKVYPFNLKVKGGAVYCSWMALLLGLVALTSRFYGGGGVFLFTLTVNIDGLLRLCCIGWFGGFLVLFDCFGHGRFWFVCLSVAVAIFSLGLVFGGYWEVRFYSGSRLEEYWKYSDSFGTLQSHSTYYPISDMDEGDKRDFYTKVERHGTLGCDWWIVNHLVWDSELDWVSAIKSGSGVTYLFDSGGSGYHHYDTRWKFTGSGTYKWFKSGAELEADSTGETYVSTVCHANDEDPSPNSWQVSFANSGHRYFDIE